MRKHSFVCFLFSVLFLLLCETQPGRAVSETSVGTPGPTVSPVVPAGTPAGKADPIVSSLFSAVNILREENNAEMLILDENLTDAAQNFAVYLQEIGELSEDGPQRESVESRASDVGYGGGAGFHVTQNIAMVWADTTADYLVRTIWGASSGTKQKLIDPKGRHIGIGTAEENRRRFVVVMIGYLTDGSVDYTPLPTYDDRTPRLVQSFTPSPAPLTTSTSQPDGGVSHDVLEGQTLSEIAQAYQVDWYTLSQLNQLDLEDPLIYEGERLIIQPSYTVTPTPTQTNTPRPPTRTPRPTFTYSVQSGNLQPTASPTFLPGEQDFFRHFLTRLESLRFQAGLILALVSGIGLILSIFLQKK